MALAEAGPSLPDPSDIDPSPGTPVLPRMTTSPRDCRLFGGLDARGGAEFAAVEEDAILDYYAADVADGLGWVTFDEDPIGEFAGCNDAEI